MKFPDLVSLAHLQPGLTPAVSAAGSRSGAAFDLQSVNQHFSGMLAVLVGAPTGTPDAFEIEVKLEHCDTSGGTYEDVAGAVIEATASGAYKVGFNPAHTKRWLRVASTVAFTAGTTPTLPNSAILALGAPRYGAAQ